MTKSKPLYVLDKQIYHSRRGDYQMAILDDRLLEWAPAEMTENRRDKAVVSEIEYAQNNRLDEHPYWHDESVEFVMEYTSFYKTLFGLIWLKDRYSRNNIVVNSDCCLTSVQYHNGVLHAYSRSTDMRNGYFSDKRVLDYLAQTINSMRPDCLVEKIQWYLACPHIYIKEGIARRKYGQNRK